MNTLLYNFLIALARADIVDLYIEETPDYLELYSFNKSQRKIERILKKKLVYKFHKETLYGEGRPITSTTEGQED